jgi:hypothetical protein
MEGRVEGRVEVQVEVQVEGAPLRVSSKLEQVHLRMYHQPMQIYLVLD